MKIRIAAGQIFLALLLIGLSGLTYWIHYLYFHDLHHILIYLVGDIAFVFIEVLLVTVIIHRILSVREKKVMLKKLNMVIGSFFSEVGLALLNKFTSYDKGNIDLFISLRVDDNWTGQQFDHMENRLKGADYKVSCDRDQLAELQRFLMEKRPFLLRLLENPNLLEHEEFTDLLWAVFHLTEELSHRDDVMSIPDSDVKHLDGDINRVYKLMVGQWLSNMEHLKKDYPYLFSLAVRTNPFNREAQVEVA